MDLQNFIVQLQWIYVDVQVEPFQEKEAEDEVAWIDKMRYLNGVEFSASTQRTLCKMKNSATACQHFRSSFAIQQKEKKKAQT